LVLKPVRAFAPPLRSSPGSGRAVALANPFGFGASKSKASAMIQSLSGMLVNQRSMRACSSALMRCENGGRHLADIGAGFFQKQKSPPSQCESGLDWVGGERPLMNRTNS
jgi:hypothetical protein